MGVAVTGKRGCLAVLGTVVLLVALLAIAAVVAWRHYLHFADTTVPASAPSVVIAPGDSLKATLRKLRAAGLAQGTELEWQLLARQVDAAGKLKVGEYALSPALSPRELLTRMRQGRVVQYRFTIVEGWNFRQLRAALATATPLQHSIDALDDAALMARLGVARQHPEGRFLPETYVYQRGDSDIDVLKRAHAAMDKALAQAWEQRAPNLPLASPEQALILASIIEKETALASERPLIAGVFLRRLQLGMKLQTDPTVIYGIGSSYDGNIRRRDLTTDTPYNTYTRTGLTPTPIAMPGREALLAAVRPAPGEALYFVAVGDGTGAHAFSATLAEHNAAVARYLQRRRLPSTPQTEPMP
ncbi:aminodeoxychorismate lyase [Xanthomonas phaseoli pv. phaseoli]|uniref:endolytic transglycosylase MltG n=1 Tax=Xanthomonas phaseoli TaxID=1985254 RepID=UPI000537B2F4|nr:endolytic transglycosylase MltG [Xanthomonas phaseoli]KGU54903.1 aminodeoxychorismate lyase [Xanthomonas phaseoli pv. phaseoli]KHF48507.1 aminodeoxychorismate lyase [Xanthomonas phaseoli pv. phaseoli]KHS08214.1 aminodeoxychorismate lyase [Xanthomonas phaseoli pv. phaseoli]KHS25015.1 aminodeoxychorismate lyase [Xanthomonas phaseoli pv. phaseoli]